MGGHATLLDMHLHMHTADGTGGALNKHTRAHLLADRRLGVRQCPLMNVYGESKGPSSFRSPFNEMQHYDYGNTPPPPPSQ